MINKIFLNNHSDDGELIPCDIPIRIGTSGDCSVRIPGPGSSIVATIDLLNGEPFIQPINNGHLLKINGEKLINSKHLFHGDRLEYFGTEILISSEDSKLILEVFFDSSSYVTQPPEESHPDEDKLDEVIPATVFKRAAKLSRKNLPSKNYQWQSFVITGILILLSISYLIFSAKSIQFDVRPEGADNIDIDGGWFRLTLADRILLRKGTYSVSVKKQGYYEVIQAFEVGDDPSDTILIEMRKLPGFVTFITDPDVVGMVTIDDAVIGETPFGPIEIEPGFHSISVIADRYLPYVDELNISGLGIEQYLFIKLVRGWGDVEISSNPSGASIFEKNIKLGVTPVVVPLLEGDHEITVVKEGFKAWDGFISTKPDHDQIYPIIELAPADAELILNSIPSGANITVNGRYRGQSPIKLALSPGIDYEIGLSKTGYGSKSRQMQLEAGVSKKITVDLSARLGKVIISVFPTDASIFIDGKVKITGMKNFDLPSRPHQLEVVKRGYESFKRNINPRPGYPQTIQVKLLTAEEARLRSISPTITNSQGQIMRRVEPGAFTMGASRREQGRRANEVIVPVELTKPFFISTKEITNREFLRYFPNHDSGAEIYPSLVASDNPVVNISWSQAVEYCNWLSEQEGLTPSYIKRFEKWEAVTPTPNGYRLPTEAEWVWGLRYQGRNSAAKFPWGNQLPPRRDSGNYADQSARKLVPSILPGYDDGFASTSPVGTFPANALGIYDAGGNVAEWVQDYYSVPQPGQTESVIDPLGPKRGLQYVIRGSGWRHAGVSELRNSFRDFGIQGRIDVGFRIAKNIQ